MAEKTKIKIGFPTFVFFSAILLLDFSLLSLIPFFTAILHELGHITVMKICGIKVSQIKILPFGVDIKKQVCVTSYKTDIIIGSAGIITNLLLLLLCLLLPKTEATELFMASNILLITINILPIRTLDGGQILEKLIAYNFDLQSAEKVVSTASFICILLLGSVSIWLLFYSSYNFTLLIMCIYLFCGIFLK